MYQNKIYFKYVQHSGVTNIYIYIYEFNLLPTKNVCPNIKRDGRNMKGTRERNVAEVARKGIPPSGQNGGERKAKVRVHAEIQQVKNR
jgi:hypothetical protein